MIAISDSIPSSAALFYNGILGGYTTTIKSNLKSLLKATRGKKRKDYIQHLLNISGKLLSLPPSALNTQKSTFNKIIHGSQMSGKVYRDFKDDILIALEYEKRRKDFYPKYFQAIGIKACVYCNAQLTISAEVEKFKKKKLVGKFQVDHYWPKSEYPCFSVSLFNLYPCCASCNNSKSKNNVDFQLYTSATSISKSAFTFTINPASVTSYVMSGNPDDIELSFGEPLLKKGKQSFEETFGISGIYNTQKDLAEEIIIKAQVYTDSFRKSLEKQFKGLFPTPGLIDRLILGNYHLEKDIHKRPFSKFSMDIARDLGLIR